MRDAKSPFEAKLSDLEHAIRRDPARRGLISSEESRGPLCPGHLAAAADHLARFGTLVGIVTGFYIPGAQPPAAETDGPPGAALLACALSRCGIGVRLITDAACRSAIHVAAREYGLGEDCVIEFSDGGERELTQLEQMGRSLSHLIAIERVGPSYRLTDYAGQRSVAEAAVAEFERLVPPEHQDRCHNMRGEIIDAYTAPLHRWFETISRVRPGVRTIGIGDGGNEIGMGSIPWNELRHRVTGPAAAVSPCRIPTDWTIVAGVSNWGALALAAGICLLRHQPDLLLDCPPEAEEHRLQMIVKEGPAVDGVTRLPEPTVDGLPFLTYIQPWERIRGVLGLNR